MREMRESGIEWIGTIPTTWELKRIQHTIEEIKVKNSPIQTEQVLSLVKDKGVMLYEDKGDVGNKAKENVSEYKLAYPNIGIINGYLSRNSILTPCKEHVILFAMDRIYVFPISHKYHSWCRL